MNAALALVLLAPAGPSAQPDVRDSVTRGLKWLAEQQKDDGSWDGGSSCTATYVTSRAGLALLMEGSTPSTGKYAPQLARAVAFFERRAEKDGRLLGADPNEVGQSLWLHADALLFLACAAEADGDTPRARKMAPIIDAGIAYALAAQTESGGWGMNAPSPTQRASAQGTAVMLRTLSAAQKCGFKVPRTALAGARAYLDREPPGRDRFTAAHVVGSALSTGGTNGPGATGLAEWVARTHPKEFSLLLSALDYSNLETVLAICRAVGMLGEGGHRRLDPTAPDAQLVRWSGYRTKAFPAVVAAQTREGNWPDPSGSPVVATASALTILQIDNGYLPAFTR